MEEKLRAEHEQLIKENEEKARKNEEDDDQSDNEAKPPPPPPKHSINSDIIGTSYLGIYSS